MVINYEGMAMKNTINGKWYDTDTAEIITSSFNRCEAIYRTQDGNWFLHVEDSGEIVPLGPDKALQWLRDTQNFDEMDEFFCRCCGRYLEHAPVGGQP